MSIFYALHRIHHNRGPGTIWLPVGLSDWPLWSCQADWLSHLYVCRVVRLTAMKLSCWLPYSWANQCCPVHMTHDSAMTTTAPVLRNRSREWFSQQASGPLQYLNFYDISSNEIKFVEMVDNNTYLGKKDVYLHNTFICTTARVTLPKSTWPDGISCKGTTKADTECITLNNGKRWWWCREIHVIPNSMHNLNIGLM